MNVILLGLLLLSRYTECAVRVDPLVLISQGLVSGRKASDGDYSMFLGIPYARVDLRNPFGPPQLSPVFEEIIFRAYDGSAKCPQIATDHSETEILDCLKLNIYVPFQASVANPLPVLVYLHGGSFSSGSAGDYGVKNLVRYGIIVVTVNYRLGPYGFMCLDVPAVTGNQGLKDQYAALRWIRRNINAFGGNPYNVTLAGQDAGAVSTLLHLYSDRQKLFHKVIVQSGAPQSEGMFVNGDVNAAIKLAEYLGLNTTNTTEALTFLTEVPYNSLTDAARDLDLNLKPCRERSFSGVENFVEYDPFSLTNENKITDTPVLIGHTNKELLSSQILYSDEYYNSDPFYRKISNNFDFDNEQLNSVAKYIRNFYIGDQAASKDLVSKFEEFESDFVFIYPIQMTVNSLLQENASPIYQYVFSYVGDTVAKGASHSAELDYLFEMAENVSKEASTKDDQLMIDQITYLWTNFVKYGDPTPEITDLVPVAWTPVTMETRPYLEIDVDLRIESRAFNERMAFWDMFYENYGKYNKLIKECLI